MVGDYFLKDMENQEIKTWLNGQRDYETGRALFEKYSRKQPLINLFRRKYKPDVLEYNLRKLVNAPAGKPQPEAQPAVTVKPGNKLEVDTGLKVKYNDLPERLKKLYDQNRDEYKLMRAVHEKMKLAQTDQERAKLRADLVKKDDLIAENWKVLDAWDGSPDRDPEPAPEKQADEMAREINSARVFISKNLKKAKELTGEKQSALKAKLQERVDLLSHYQVELSEATKKGLMEIGL